MILGSLIKKPSLFLEDKYVITEQDFVERFHSIIFGAIKNLYLEGVKTITALEIDKYLSSYAVQKKIFDDNNGIQYVDNLIKFAKVENFDFHYNILKKYTLLRKLKASGMDVSCFIDESIVDPKKIEEMMCKFNNLTTNDILNEYDRRLVEVKD
jgi:replicative DNA helicase